MPDNYHHSTRTVISICGCYWAQQMDSIFKWIKKKPVFCYKCKYFLSLIRLFCCDTGLSQILLLTITSLGWHTCSEANKTSTLQSTRFLCLFLFFMLMTSFSLGLKSTWGLQNWFKTSIPNLPMFNTEWLILDLGMLGLWRVLSQQNTPSKPPPPPWRICGIWSKSENLDGCLWRSSGPDKGAVQLRVPG